MGIFRRISTRIGRAIRAAFGAEPPPQGPPSGPPPPPEPPDTLFGPPEGPGYSWTVAGYVGADGFTYDVEAGHPEPSDRDLELGGRVVVRVTDARGIDHYYTILGAITADYTIDDAISDILERYSGEFV